MRLVLHIVLTFVEILIALQGKSGNLSAAKVKNENKVLVSSEFITVGRNVWNCHELNACDDKLGLEAILLLHQRLDDDANGNIDIAESDDFLRDELKYSNSYERQKGFHRNDKHITADELWLSWKISEVHNWTVQETVNWLVLNVELPQYTQNFLDNSVDGTALPRMAVNSLHFLSNLGIKDPIHKQKISLKAMDIVLFGPPKNHNYVKDGVLILSLIIATCGCWFAYIQHKKAQSHLKKTMKDMDNLQHAEESLRELQKELDEARQQQELAASEKKNLERQLRNEIEAVKHQYDSEASGDSKVQALEQELRIVMEDLRSAEKTLEENCWVASPALQQWLQLTYEMELQHYNAKKSAAEHQLLAAKEGCEKLRKKRSSFLGTFRVAHGSSIDDVDNRISQAKAALSEVTKDLQERLNRWKQIEMLCGFPVVHNPGIRHLKSLLGNSAISNMFSTKTCGVESHVPQTSSTGTLDDDDSVCSFPAGISAIQHLVHNSATLFLAPLPSATTNHLSMQRCPSCSSPFSDDNSFPSLTRKPCFSVNASNNEEHSLYGSLANIPHSISQRSGINITAVEQVSSHNAKKISSSDLKACASSSAILQRADAVYSEHSDSPSTDCESFDDKTSFLCGQRVSDPSKAIFVIGESGKDSVMKAVVPSGLKHRKPSKPSK